MVEERGLQEQLMTRRVELNQALRSLDSIWSEIEEAIVCLYVTLTSNKRVFVCGNGGSAADAQHFAAELCGKFEVIGRRPLPVIALTCNTSILTAVGNDFSFEEIFSKQIEAHAEEDDLVIGFTTSGQSKNVLNALRVAKDKKCSTICFTGRDMNNYVMRRCDHTIKVDSNKTAIIQDVHGFLIHYFCQIIDTSKELNNAKLG